MLFYRYTSRPARLGALLAYTAREALDNVTVDLSGIEETLSDQIAALSERMDRLQEKLEAYDESIEEATNTKATPKAKQTAKRSGASARKTRAKKA